MTDNMTDKMPDKMTDLQEWKKAMKESNAIGWIAFFVLIVAIGVGTVYFGTTSPNPTAKPATTAQVAK
jgi:hypothetical protein